MAHRHIERVLELVQQSGVLRSRDLDALGIPREVLRRMCARGLLYRVGRGLYVRPDADVTESHTLAEAAKAVPHGVVCLLSALCFHGLTSQAPFEVWMAIAEKAWHPRTVYPPLRAMRFSASALQAGIEVHDIEGVAVRVYSPAKTVADCFKYRNKIGLDVALEALHDCREQNKCTETDLWQYAQVCRVARVMRPYLEATL
jgi:predicted transcriptional regulator of viral defense system